MHISQQNRNWTIFGKEIRADWLLLHNGVALPPFRRLDNILGTRVIKRIWSVNRNKRVEPFQGGMHHDENRVGLMLVGQELE